MQNEIRQYNNIGDVEGITYFLELVISENRISRNSVQKLCALRNNIRINISGAVLLLSYLNIISEKEGYLYPTEIGLNLKKSNNIEIELCKLCLKKAISDALIDVSTIHYNTIKGEYYIDKFGFSVSAALIRNILLQFHALKESPNGFVISTGYEDVFIEQQKKYKISLSLEKLKKQLEKQEKQGELAESFVLKYESERLAGHPLVKEIKQISVIDVTAGYDIVSFRDYNSTELDYFIEVKSFQGKLHFYWSQNEIEKAKLYEDRYSIYLVDVSKIDDPHYQPRIIDNPAKKIMENDDWIVNPTSYFVMPTE